MSFRRAGGVWLLLLSLTHPSIAAEPSEAETRYSEGLKAFEAGNYVAACQKLAESYRLDPLPGALFTLATCEMRAGRLATAASRFTEFLELVEKLPAEAKQRQAERSAVATRERSALYPKIPHLKVILDGAAPTRSVALNGAALPTSSLNIELAVDPGEQLLEQHLESGASLSQRISLTPGESKVVVLRANQGTAARSPAPGRDVPAAAPRRSNALAYTLGGIGAAGIVVGAVAGGLAMHQASIVEDNCDGSACSPSGKRAADKGQNEALVSSIAFGIGVVGVVTGVLLLTTGESAPAPQAARLDLRLTPRSITLEGAF